MTKISSFICSRALKLEQIVSGKDSDTKVKEAALSCVEENPSDIANVVNTDRNNENIDENLDSETEALSAEAMEWAIQADQQ